MKDENLDREILAYVTDGGGRLVPQRCGAGSLEKRGWLGYLNERFPDITSEKERLRETLYRMLGGIESAPKCKGCGKPLTFRNNSFPLFCCAKCRNSDPDVKRKNAESVGVSLRRAYRERGGDIKKKRRDSMEEKYGESVTSAFSLKPIREKAKSTVCERYGVDNVMRLPEFHAGARQKSRERSVEKWKERGYDICYTDRDTVIIRNGCPVHGDIELDVRTFVNRMKPERRNVSPVCVRCHPLGDMSGQEREMCEFLDSLGVSYTRNDRTVIRPLELDFYVPDYGVAIEMNGVYFHSEMSGKERTYHKRKTELCESKGIRLLHVWETDWISRNALVKSMIAARLGKSPVTVNARDCEFAEIGSKEFRAFLAENHLQGKVNAKYRFALTYNGEPVSVMGFGKMRISVGAKREETACELYRFCNKAGYNVRGGASKLFSHAVAVLREEGYESVVTYAKRDWSDGKLYSDVLGFSKVGVTEPGYFWADSRGNVLGRYSCRKSEIARTEEEMDMSESEIMKSRGFMKCYDSGNLVFRYKMT